MAAELRELFRQQLAERLQRRGLSQRLVGELLAEHGGEKVTGSAVSEWVRGISKPGRVQCIALERLLEVEPGAWTEMLGYAPPTPATPNLSERVAVLEDSFREMVDTLGRVEQQLEALVAKRRRHRQA